MRRTLLFLFALCLFIEGNHMDAQTRPETYVWPKDPEVLKNLKKWQGYKFGLLIHMGLYSELGTIESWGLCPEEWVGREVDNYYEYANELPEHQIHGSIRRDFDPAKWARMFKSSGAKYMIYSSKHHDGFCLYDTKYTDFKVTDKGCPVLHESKIERAEGSPRCNAEGRACNGSLFLEAGLDNPLLLVAVLSARRTEILRMTSRSIPTDGRNSSNTPRIRSTK